MGISRVFTAPHLRHESQGGERRVGRHRINNNFAFSHTPLVCFPYFRLCNLQFQLGPSIINISLFSPCVLTSADMDSGACEDKDLSPKLAEKLNEVSGKEAVDLSKVANGKTLLEPITPVPNRETADSAFDCKKSPLSEAKRPSKVSCFDSKTSTKDDPIACVGDGSPQTPRDVVCLGDISPQTPRDVVFDPFAPGPEHLAMAPLNKKYNNKTSSSVVRRLDFESSLHYVEHNKTRGDNMESISDDEMFKSVYNNLLEAIVSKQTEGFLAEISNIEWDSDSCKTPPGPHLNGIAETCPGAPMKSSAVSRKIDLGLCRKLEF